MLQFHFEFDRILSVWTGLRNKQRNWKLSTMTGPYAQSNEPHRKGLKKTFIICICHDGIAIHQPASGTEPTLWEDHRIATEQTLWEDLFALPGCHWWMGSLWLLTFTNPSCTLSSRCTAPRRIFYLSSKPSPIFKPNLAHPVPVISDWVNLITQTVRLVRIPRWASPLGRCPTEVPGDRVKRPRA